MLAKTESYKMFNGLSLYVPSDAQDYLARYLQAKRKEKKFSRRELALRTGVPESTIKHFEYTGKISLSQFLELWFCLDNIERLIALTQRSSQPKNKPRTIEEVLKR